MELTEIEKLRVKKWDEVLKIKPLTSKQKEAIELKEKHRIKLLKEKLSNKLRKPIVKTIPINSIIVKNKLINYMPIKEITEDVIEQEVALGFEMEFNN